MKTEHDLYQALDALDIEYTVHEHEAFFTCEQGDAFFKEHEGAHNKNLFLRDRKGRTHYLVTIESHKRLDLKAFAEQIGASPLSFASPERLERILHLQPGSVSPFALIQESAAEVKVFYDQDILDQEKTYHHPLRNTASVEIGAEGMRRFLESLPNEVEILKL